MVLLLGEMVEWEVLGHVVVVVVVVMVRHINKI